MNLHEYQAKELMRRHGVPVPAGEPATSVEEAKAAIEKLFGEGHQRVVVVPTTPAAAAKVRLRTASRVACIWPTAGGRHRQGRGNVRQRARHQANR